ncbi:MAG: HAD family hydrolase [Spirochaetales bacterium]|nr:HAD family hydrolase [Spirochaetales bacterium]
MNNQDFSELKGEKEFLAAIDSDGCVLNTMNTKHRLCLIPAFIKHFRLEEIAREAEETWEYVNLFSENRAQNRFKALSLTLKELGRRADLKRQCFKIPSYEAIHKWVQKNTGPSQSLLEHDALQSSSWDLQLTLSWSKEVEKMADSFFSQYQVFDYARESLQKLNQRSDCFVVSTSAEKTLHREWEHHRIKKYVKTIVGRENGEKAINLVKGAGQKYLKHKCIMIGDSPGDLVAAQTAAFLFYPIFPGQEAQSWKHFYTEIIDSFWKGEYLVKQQPRLIQEFTAFYSSPPPWELLPNN